MCPLGVNAPKELHITQKGELVVIVKEGLDCCWVLLELLQAEARLPRAARREWEEEGRRGRRLDGSSLEVGSRDGKN